MDMIPSCAGSILGPGNPGELPILSITLRSQSRLLIQHCIKAIVGFSLYAIFRIAKLKFACFDVLQTAFKRHADLA
jgi:hypothetical protein